MFGSSDRFKEKLCKGIKKTMLILIHEIIYLGTNNEAMTKSSKLLKKRRLMLRYGKFHCDFIPPLISWRLYYGPIGCTLTIRLLSLNSLGKYAKGF